MKKAAYVVVTVMVLSFCSPRFVTAEPSAQPLQVEPTTGSANFSFPMSVAQGRAGIQPNLGLSYSSSARNGIFGAGWDLDLGSIQLSTKNGVPKYDGNDKYIMAQGSPMELVYDSAAGLYRPQIEGAFMKIEKLAAGWRVTDKKGTKYLFGQTNASREFDPANPARIFKWALDRVEDINGNYMTVTYQAIENQLYPQYIDYTGNAVTSEAAFARVTFELEDRTDFSLSYMTGFAVKTTKRVKKISSAAGASLLGAYQLNYQYSAESGRSLINQIVQIGADGVSTLPPVTFTYQVGTKGFAYAPAWQPPGPKFVGDWINGRYPDLGVRVFDVNADGYPDIVRNFEDCGGSRTKEIYLNNKSNAWQLTTAWTIPSNIPGFVKGCTDFDRDKGFRFSDINGDGWTDIVWHYRDNSGTYQNGSYINNQTNTWVYNSGWNMQDFMLAFIHVVQTPVPDVHQFMGVVLADVNGDGMPDAVKAREGDEHRTLINKLKTGGGWVEDVTWRPLGDQYVGIYTNFGTEATLVDLNGDNLLDIFIGNTGHTIAMNTGAGWKQDATSPWSNTLGYGNWTDGTTQFADVNGDGLVDLVVGKENYANGSRTLLNTGYGWREDTGWVVPAVFQYGRAQLLDANGDNMLDVLWNDTTGSGAVHLNQSKVPDLLVKINNGSGGITDVEYTSSQGCTPTFFPFHIQVVSAMTVSNSLGDSYKTTYKYAKGLWDNRFREFRGFGYVKVKDPLGNYTETNYFQDDVFKGRVKDQATFNSTGQLFAKTVNTWGLQAIITDVNFITLNRADNFVYDGNATGKRTAQEFYFSESPQRGNLTKVIQLGEVDLATGADIGADKRTVETVYNNNTSGTNWLSGLPKLTTVKNNAATIVRQSWFYYDNNALDTVPVKGQVTKKEDWAGSPAGTPAVNPTSQYTYDAYGNLATTKDPKNNTTSITYDTTYRMFPLRTTNAITHQINNEYYGVNGVALDSGGYRGLWGQIKSTTDPNNQQGKRIYDTFGRMTTTISPLDSLTSPTALTEYTPAGTYVKIVKKQRIKSGQTPTIDVVEFYDGLGRLIQTKAKSETAGQYVVSGQTQYNSRGLPEKKYLPFFTTVDMNSMTAIDTAKPKTVIDYDAVGRMLKTTNADGTFANVTYDDWTTSATDENGHMQKSQFDAYGRLIRKEEYLGADGRSPHYPAGAYTLYAATLYTYDSEGNLTQTQDAKNNITTIAYDKLGRKTGMDDPDMGVWQYGYDINGNLSFQIDAKTKQINFTYDALNRLTNKADGAVLNVSYTYDDVTASNSKGRLGQASYGTAGNTKFTYDPMGREIASIKTIGSASHQVTRTYDALDRLEFLKYPDQTGLAYTYNAAGQVETVKEGVAQ